MKKTKQILSVLLCVILTCSVFVISAQAKDTRKYVKSVTVKKKATVTIPASKKTAVKTYKVKVKVNGKASKKFTAKSSDKSVAAVKVVSGKLRVTAKKAGKASIKVTTKAKNLKGKKLTKTLKLTVKKAKTAAKAVAKTPTAAVPATTEVQATTAPATTAEPTATESVTVEPTAPVDTAAAPTATEPTSAPEDESDPDEEEPEDSGETTIYNDCYDMELDYSEYAEKLTSGVGVLDILDIVRNPKQNASYSIVTEDKNVADFDEPSGNLYSTGLGKTSAVVYEQIEGQDKAVLGEINITVITDEMADVAESAFNKTDIESTWLKLDFGKKSYDLAAAIEYSLNSDETGVRMKPEDYTVTYNAEKNEIAELSSDGIITGTKNGEAYFDMSIKFKDGSEYSSNIFVQVTGAAIEKVDGYTIDNIRDYVVGLDTPVELRDGTKIPLTNFDNAATTPALKAVQDAINKELEMYGSIGRGFSQKSNHSTDIYNSTRDKVLEFLTADPELYTCFYVNSTTDGLNKLASALIESEDDVVLTTRIEHHANDLSWRERCKVIYAEVDEKGRVIYDDIEKLLKENQVKLVSVSAASNVTGYVNDVHRVAKMAHKYGAKVVVDGAQIVAHRKFSMMGDLDDPDDDIDFIAFSAHKMYSPYGGGAVVGLTEELNEHMPEFYGGGTITLVGDDWQLYKKAPAAYEAGSPNYPGVVGLGKAIDVLSTIGMDNIEAHEKVLNKKIIEGLKKLDNIILYGDSENIDDRVGVISFNFSDINTYLLSESLSQLGGIATRRGAFCAHPYVWRLMKIDEETVKGFENCSDVNTAGMVRVSFGIYNNEADVDYFLDIMPKAMQDAKDRNIDEMADPMY